MAELTLEDIATTAGVSRSTVSRVLNHQPNVRADVRERVWAVIQQTGYHPNAAARTLASQRSWMIGLVLPKSVGTFFSDPYFPQLTRGIAQACNQNEYTLGLFIMDSREEEEKLYPRISRTGLLDGILVQAGSTGDHLVERLLNSTMPMVYLGRPLKLQSVSFIDVANISGAKKAVSHLIHLGRKRIAHISGPTLSTAAIDRTQGYLDALAEAGMPVDTGLIRHGDFTESSGFECMQQLLAAHPDAVFTASDAMAYGAMRAITSQGLSIPAEVAVVGFDDLPTLQPPLPDLALTTVRQPIHEFGMQAVQLLIEVMDSPAAGPQGRTIETELLIRDTCGSHLACPV
jgi:LacI family transcriptional regulator